MLIRDQVYNYVTITIIQHINSLAPCLKEIPLLKHMNCSQVD